jgi:hypothetical protein
MERGCEYLDPYILAILQFNSVIPPPQAPGYMIAPETTMLEISMNYGRIQVPSEHDLHASNMKVGEIQYMEKKRRKH